MAKPKFDPSKPFEPEGGKPRFDPAKPFEPEGAGPQEAPGPRTSGTEAFASGLGQSALGLGDELGGLGQAELQALAGAYRAIGGKGDWKDVIPEALKTYRNARDENRMIDKAAKEQHPAAYYTGLAGGTIATAPLLPGIAPLKGAGLGGRLVAGALTGMGQGAAYGAGMSDADLTKGEVDRFAVDTLGGGLIGAAASPVGVGIAKGAGFIGRKALGGVAEALGPLVRPSAAAQALEAKGVQGLTIGQMAPNSTLAQLEEAGQSLPVVGNILKGQREAGREAWQQAVLREARAPVVPGAQAGDAAEQLSKAYGDFGSVYDSVGSHPAQPVLPTRTGLKSIADAFKEAAEDPSIYATDSDVNAAKRFLANQASLLTAQQSAPGAAAAPLRASVLINVRQNIRGAIREALQRQDYTAAKLLGNAEGAVTDSLEFQLPKDALGALRAADSQYGQHKVVSDAVRRAGDATSGFSPANLSAAVKSSTEAGRYARGAGGDLRDLAQAGRESLDVRIPPTGARLVALTGLPGVSHLLGGAAAVANTAPVKQALLRGIAPGASAALRAASVRAPAAAAEVAPATWNASTSHISIPDIIRRNPQALGAFANYFKPDAPDEDNQLTAYVLTRTNPKFADHMRKLSGEPPGE